MTSKKSWVELPIPVPNLVISYCFLHDAIIKDCKKNHHTKQSRETCYLRYSEKDVLKEVANW